MTGPFSSGFRPAATGRQARHLQDVSNKRREQGTSVRFDGATGIQTPTGVSLADTRVGIVSVWFLPNLFGAQRFLLSSSPTRMDMVLESSDRITFSAFRVGGGDAISQGSSSSFPVDGTWVHALWSFDNQLASPRSELYQNDVSNGAAPTFNDFDIGLSDINNIVVGTNLAEDRVFSGYIGEIWADYTTTLDLDLENNRRRFIKSDGRRVDLGPNGINPLGTKPSLYYKADGFTGFNQGRGEVPDLSEVRLGQIFNHIGQPIRIRRDL